MKERKIEDIQNLYKTQWRTYYKPGLGAPAIVYGESEHDAMANALALYRKNVTAVDFKPMAKVVDHVEFIG